MGVSGPLLSLGLPTRSSPTLSMQQAPGVHAQASPILSAHRPPSPVCAAGGEGPWGPDPPSLGPRARLPPPACGAQPARQGGNEYGSCLPAADASSPTGTRNIKLQGTGHHSQLKFLLFPWKEPRRQPGPRAKNPGPGDSRRRRGLRESGLRSWAAEGQALGDMRGSAQERPCSPGAGTALLSQDPERRVGLLPSPAGTHSCGQPCLPLPGLQTPTGQGPSPGVAALDTVVHTDKQSGKRADHHQGQVKVGSRCSVPRRAPPGPSAAPLLPVRPNGTESWHKGGCQSPQVPTHCRGHWRKPGASSTQRPHWQGPALIGGCP